MKNVNHWKEAYKHLWGQSSAKEEMLKIIIEAETGLTLVPFGLGAGSTDYISGSAKDNNNIISAPDFKIVGQNIKVYIEVTGPLNKNILPQRGLWIRPDKLNYAYKHMTEAEEFFALYFPAVQEWYVIHANKDFFEDVKNNRDNYKEFSPTIRGNKEKCVEIKYDNPHVKDLSALIDFLKRLKE